MRDIAIVGAGQGGLQLALGLLSDGYRVTMISNRNAEDIETGRVMSSQCMFDKALQLERDLGINFWEDETPDLGQIGIYVGDGDAGTAIAWRTPLPGYAQSLDQRVKMAGWLRAVEDRGGKVVIEEADIAALERYAQTHDLVVVAAGKGELGSLFPLMSDYMPFDGPMRMLSSVYVHGLKPREGGDTVAINIQPGIGEMVTFPALTTTGVCDIMTFEAVPDGPLDVWRDVRDVGEQVEIARAMVEKHFPWEAPRLGELEPTDPGGGLVGAIRPTVRGAAGALPSGALVLGLGDAIVLNDPAAGQGSNNASRGAELYRRRIRERGGEPFDRAWMEEIFTAYWDDYARWATEFTNALLVPPPDHVIEILAAAGENREIAQRLAKAFDNPIELSPWFYDSDAARKMLAEYSTETA